MSTFFFRRGYLLGEVDQLERRLESLFVHQRQGRKNDRARVEELELDLARVALLARALADLCIAKGVLTQEELVRQLNEADLADGKQDQKLPAKVVMPGESKAADPETPRAAKKDKLKRKRPYP
jgi:hypothetical protein